MSFRIYGYHIDLDFQLLSGQCRYNNNYLMESKTNLDKLILTFPISFLVSVGLPLSPSESESDRADFLFFCGDAEQNELSSSECLCSD